MNRHHRTRRLTFPCLETLDGRVLPSHVLHPLAHHVRPHAAHRAAIAHHVATPAQNRVKTAPATAFHAVNVGGPTDSSGSTSGSFFYTITNDGQTVYHAASTTPDPTPDLAPTTITPESTTAAPAVTTSSTNATTAPVESTNPSGTFFYTLVTTSDGGSAVYH